MSKKAISRKAPPGQRLIKYFGFAATAVLLQGWASFDGQTHPKGLNQPVVNIAEPFPLLNEQYDLEAQLKNLGLRKPLRIGAFAVNPKDGHYINVQGKEAFSAASMIKLPILISLLQAIDSHELSFNKILTIKPEEVTGGSGHLQWQPAGTKISLQDTARLMIIFSDNTATNMIIDALGGKERINKDFYAWGLQQTKINNYLGDFTGTNKTSPYDMVYLLGRVDRGELISDASREWMMGILKKTRVRTLLVPGLGPGAQLAHKTGDIASMVGDAGIVTTSDGKKYYVAMQVERPRNDLRANLLIRDASKLLFSRLAGVEIATSKLTK